MTDPTTGKIYITRDWRVDGGAVRFDDCKSGMAVALSTAEVHKISKVDYQLALEQEDVMVEEEEEVMVE